MLMAGLRVGALPSTSGAGGEREGQGNLYYCPQCPWNLHRPRCGTPRPQHSQRRNSERWLLERPQVSYGWARWFAVRALQADRTKLECRLPNRVNHVSHFSSLGLNFLTCKMGHMLHLTELPGGCVPRRMTGV